MAPLHLLALLPLALTACGPEKDDTGSEGDTDADTDADTDMTGTFSGQVLLEDGSPAAGQAQLCSTRCMTAALDAEGRFEFSNLTGGRHGFHMLMDGGYAEGLVLYDLVADEDNVMPGPYRALPWAGTTVVPGGATEDVALDGGLTVTIDTDTVALPLGETEYAIASVAVPPELQPEQATLDGEVVGFWYLGPFDAQVDPPAPFVVAPGLGLDEGTVLRIRTAAYVEVDWADGGTATVQADGSIVSDAGSGIPDLTTLALVR